MRRVLWLLLLAAPAAAGDTKAIAEFRLKSDPLATCYGWIVAFDAEGFRFERFGGAQRTLVGWDDLVEEDARALRRRLGLALGEGEGPRLVPAHRLRFRNGAVLEGLLLRVDPLSRHWVKSEGIVMPYPGDLVAKVEEIEVEESRVFGLEELYLRRLDREPPRTAQEHADLATYLFDIGNFERARAHYEEAVAGEPLLRQEVQPRLERIAEYLADAHAARLFAKAKRRASLEGDLDGAVRLVEEYVAAHPGARRRGYALIDELRAGAAERRARDFHAVKNRELHRAVDDFLRRRDPDLETALRWATEELPKEIEGRVRERLGLGAEEYGELAGRPARGAPHWASYWTGTFVVGKRTKPIGQRRADGEAWWRRYDVGTRSSFLKAYAAERLPALFEVVQVTHHDCTRCGGRGQVKKFSFTSVGGPQQHEWYEVCPLCWGNGRDRGVAYR